MKDIQVMETTEQSGSQSPIQRNQPECGEIVLYQPNENIRIEVRLDKETVWLTQAQMVDLFASTKQNISLHINNIFKEGELVKDSTVKEYLTVQTEGNRKINRRLIYYNLDVIISVGYRVKSPIGTQFRIWANGVLKQYLLKGYAYQAQLMYVETRLDKHLQSHDAQIMELQQQVEFLVDVHKQSSGRIFPTGCVFDAWEYVSGLVREAKERIILIDNYCDERTLVLLSKRMRNVSCVIHTRYNAAFDADLEKHNAQYPKVEKVQLSQKEHDRFLIIDDTVYILGDSLKDLGHSLTTVLRTSFAPDVILELLK